MADLESVNKRFHRVEKLARQKDKEALVEYELLNKIKEGLENDQPFVL